MSRKELEDQYGMEVILRCCRDWKCHYDISVYRGGRCGICKQNPVLVEGMKWEN